MFDKADKLYDLIVRVIQIIRYGKREKVLLTFAVLLGAGATQVETRSLIPPVAGPYVTYGLYGVALVLLVAAIVRIWKQAIPPTKDDEAAVRKPAALKGPMAFGKQDGALFAQLGREAELRKLLGYVLDDQMPLVVVMGESGAGKTSLLRAGLEYTLAEGRATVPAVPIYWEAFPSDPVAGLLRTLQSGWRQEENENAGEGNEKPFPEMLDDLLHYNGSPRRVIILDQMEQLSPERHAALFEVLRRVVQRTAPHPVTWVVAFRKEYAGSWLDFESAVPGFYPPRLSIKRFSIDEAVAVMAMLAHEGEVRADQDVIRRLAGSIAQDGKVSPVDIGISLFVLSELAGRADAAIDDTLYQAAGEEAGLLASYIKDRMAARIPDYEQEPVMLALLHLIDPETDQRVAEGRTVAELVEASGLPPPRLENHLGYFESRSVRLLEGIVSEAQSKTYRLAHERLIPALRHLAGVLTAQAAQAERLLDERFRSWRREPKTRLLLTPSELRRVLRFQEQFRWGGDREGKVDYVRRSKNRRTVLYGFVGFVMVLTAVGLMVLNKVRIDERHRDDFRQWGLPADLYDRLGQLDTLAITGLNITNQHWLQEGIDSLALYLTNIEAGSFPRSLTALTLDVNGSRINSLPELPSGLTTLALNLGYTRRITDLPDLPSGLTTLALNLSGSRVNSLPELPSGLTTLALNLSGSRVNSLPELPSGLTTLMLDVIGIDSLPALDLPEGLTTLTLNIGGIRMDSLPELPSGLTTLTLYVNGIRIDSLSELDLPTGLTALTLYVNGTLISTLPDLPEDFTTLALYVNGGGITDLPDLPSGLTTLTLDVRDTEISSLLGLPLGLSRLEVSLKRSQITTLDVLPPSVHTLVLHYE